MKIGLESSTRRHGKMNLQDSLNEHLARETQIDDRFVVDNEEKANWALRKIAEHEQKIKDAIDFATQEISKIESWLNQIKEERQNKIDHLQSMLAEYAMKQREKDPSFKSMKLPNGSFGFRKQQVRWNYDDKQLLESLKEKGMTDFIKVEYKVNKRDLKRALKVANNKVINPETGEVVEGVTIEEQ